METLEQMMSFENGVDHLQLSSSEIPFLDAATLDDERCNEWIAEATAW